jgi:hypothetical protein
MNAWSTKVLSNGVRLLIHTCDGCRCVTSFDRSDDSTIPVVRCCKSAKPFPIKERKFAKFLATRRPADADHNAKPWWAELRH